MQDHPIQLDPIDRPLSVSSLRTCLTASLFACNCGQLGACFSSDDD